MFKFLKGRRPVGLQTQVIGICRFSYPAIGGFQVKHTDSKERAEYLYSASRLDERFRIFQSITLPSLKAQTDADFSFLIVVGNDLPKFRHDQLRDLTRDVPQIVVKAFEPGQHRKVMQDAINSLRVPNLYSIQFRNDDDDAINREFVAKTRATVNLVPEFVHDNRHIAIDFVNGYNARISSQGIHVVASRRLFLGVAFAAVFRPDVSLCIMNFSHHEIWHHMPTITRNDDDMWIRGINEHNDSGASIELNAPVLTEIQERQFKLSFGIDSQDVRRIYANSLRKIGDR